MKYKIDLRDIQKIIKTIETDDLNEIFNEVDNHFKTSDKNYYPFVSFYIWIRDWFMAYEITRTNLKQYRSNLREIIKYYKDF